jgi:hypothetical protein
MAKVKIACPAGSGMNFAQQLLQLSFYNAEDQFPTGGHERKDILEEVPTLVIVRHPYDAIASGAERWLKSSDHEAFKNNTDLIDDLDIDNMVKRIEGENFRYVEFLKDIESLSHVKLFTFDFLTQNPQSFVKEVAKYFKIKNEITIRSIPEVLQVVVDSGNANRIPREKSAGRKQIENLIMNIYREKEFDALKIYSSLKEKLDKELI